jgi:hypothetical protein
VFGVSQVTRYRSVSVMCVSAICAVKFHVLQPGKETGMRLNLEDDGGDITIPGHKRSDECVWDTKLFCAWSKTF